MLVLIGKMGTGKDTIKKELMRFGFESVVTSTTRPMRKGEVQDVSYHFLTEEEFFEKKSKGEFAEVTSYDTVHGKWYYGTQFEDLKNHKSKVMIVNPDGIKSFIDMVDMTDWFVVHIKCDENIVCKRLVNRGDNQEEIERRFIADKRDFMNIDRLCDVEIANDGSISLDVIAHRIYYLYTKDGTIKNYEK